MTGSKSAKIFVIILVINLSLPIFFININNSLLFDTNPENGGIILPKTQIFQKKDYEPIIYAYDNGLGNITVNDMEFSDLELGFYLYNPKYPLLFDDYNNSALNMTLTGMEFINTLEPAIHDNINPDIVKREIITVQLNETLNITYVSSVPNSEGYIIYGPRLAPCHLSELYVKEAGASGSPIKVDEVNYSIDENNFLYFNYENYFMGSPPPNFYINIIWDYNISVDNWNLDRHYEGNIPITEQEQSFERKFEYKLNLLCYKFGANIDQIILGDDKIKANLTLNLPDKELLSNHTIEIGETINDIADHLNLDKSIHTDLIQGNNTRVLLNFTAIFTVKFINPVENTWAIDRLVGGNNIRERIYLPTISSGPEHICIYDLEIFERTITSEQVLATSILFDSPFKRNLLYSDANVSDWEDEPTFLTDNDRESRGINITLPFLIKNEICPFIIKYSATENLTVRILDNIGMPLVGLDVVVNYYGKPFGTYISNNRIQPISTQSTDINAEFIIDNVPNGEYLIQIYMFGIYQGEYTINSYADVNYIKTSIVHFPLWILIFGLINLSVLALGYKFYKNKKKRQ
ncbi:MAG: hypothetical protein ACFFBP_20970 [Promethearchaeota archaeon]